ncbi:unnamed protein product [Durusdinium trenchii]|uniref:Uncharacterized protein n=2 Tax=Durusdinium trenchii TaxID=1381693 RepID=A0ABP0S449_9DINO
MADKNQKLTQAELLELLSPPPFNQKKCVPPDAVILTSPEERWWRSDSPRLPGDQFPDVPPPKVDPTMSATTGSKGHGLRQGPILFQTTAQTGCGTAAHFKMEEGVPPVISGFSGHFPGKQGANVIGATFDKSYTESLSHTISLGK